MRTSSRWTGIALTALTIIVGVIWYAVSQEDRSGVMTISFLDVGQGDAIFIDAPSGRQVLIDGGVGTTVLRSLSAVMPWYDRSIDIVIGTHPDADHIGGLLEIFPRYQVGMIIRSSVGGTTPLWERYEEESQKETTQILTAERGQMIDLGKGAYLEILFPDRNVPNIETNTGCIFTRLVYGETAFMLPCDAPDDIERYLVRLDGTHLKSNVLKAAHHGSKTSSLPAFVGYVDPQYVIYSRGCDNTYGHPHQQTINTFARFGVPTLDTCEEGTITFVSDGQTVGRK